MNCLLYFLSSFLPFFLFVVMMIWFGLVNSFLWNEILRLPEVRRWRPCWKDNFENRKIIVYLSPICPVWYWKGWYNTYITKSNIPKLLEWYHNLQLNQKSLLNYVLLPTIYNVRPHQHNNHTHMLFCRHYSGNDTNHYRRNRQIFSLHTEPKCNKFITAILNVYLFVPFLNFTNNQKHYPLVKFEISV